MTAQARHTTFLNSQAQETGRKQTNTEISHVSLFVHPSLLGALQCSQKKHPALPSSRILLDAAQILQESRYFCAVSSTDQKCAKRTKVANHGVISVGQTVSSKPYGNNGIELQANTTQPELPLGPKQRAFANSLVLWLSSANSSLRQSQGLCSLPTSQPQALHLHSSPKAHDKMTKA